MLLLPPLPRVCQEPQLSDFTATDRRRIVEKLMGDDYVLEALHHVIFSVPEDRGAPGSAGSAGSGGGGMDGAGFGFIAGIPGMDSVPDDVDVDEKQRTG